MTPIEPGYVYVGTYTTTLPHVKGKGDGIYVFTVDQKTGALHSTSVMSGVLNPSFITLAPSGRYLYAVNETKDASLQYGGGVNAFSVDIATGALTFLNRQSSNGGDPCHLILDANGSFVIVVNHENGTVAVYPVQPDGSLGKATDVIQHIGSSVHPQRQRGPHPHSVNIDSTNNFAFVCDKGIDKIMVYRLDRVNGKLVPNDPSSVKCTAGFAPRHLAIHPTRPYVFVINEIASTITSFEFDAAKGALKEIHSLSTLPADFTDCNNAADIHVHPNGKFVYGSNRGHDSIAIFALHEATGRLMSLGQKLTEGSEPRNFSLDPTGAILLVANQNSDNIVAFHVDPNCGALTPTGAITQVPTPACIKFAPRL